jgi:DNA replication protein DnaC
MVQAMETQMTMPDVQSLSFEERLGLMVDQELITRENRRLITRLRLAKFRQQACVEDLDLRNNRGLDRSVITSLATSQWVQSHQNILIIGPTGVGKSYLACALAQKACRDGYTAVYDRAPRLFQDLTVAKADGRYGKVLVSLAKKNVLVIDDFALSPLNDEQRRDLLELVEDRYEKRSTILASQIPIEHWHETIGDPTFADAILDRLIHNAHKLILKGDSMRKSKSKKQNGE